MQSILTPCVIVMVLTVTLCAAQEGLVAHYAFDEGAGAVCKDASGLGNDGELAGQAGWDGGALRLNGADAYVDCGAAASLNLGHRGALSVWVKPQARQGGILNWSTGGGWNDERLVLAINTYHGGEELLLALADGRTCQTLRDLGELPLDEWTHLAVVLDGQSVRIYRDGGLEVSVSLSVQPATTGVPPWIGRCQGLGRSFFHGLIDEVRVYDRPMTHLQVLGLYKEEAVRMGKDTTYFTCPKVSAEVLTRPGKLHVSVDARAMHPLPAGARVAVALDGADPATSATVDIPAAGAAEAILDLQPVAPGNYRVNAFVIDAEGKPVGQARSAEINWPGQDEAFRKVRVLNNLCWELLDAEPAEGQARYEFTNPTDRWVFFRSTAQCPEGGRVGLALDGDDTALATHTAAGESTLEAMRYLKAGEYVLRAAPEAGARLSHLTVRSIPMLQHAFYGANPHIHPYGPYDWEFLARDVLPNVNVMIGGAGEQITEWVRSGRQWISIIALPKIAPGDPNPVDTAYNHWSQALGMQHPLMSGVIVDEFGGGDDPIYDVYRQAIERIGAAPQFAGRGFSPYGGTFYGKDRSALFAQASLDTGGYIAWERYLQEQPDEDAARGYIKRTITDEMPRWEARFPNAASKICLVLGYMSQPTESLNIDPGVDYRAFMDLQLRTLATHPSLFGLGGIQEYHSSYCDEENVRLAGRLYRHYAIEGRTEPFIDTPYSLTHIRNPDFAEGSEGWQVQAAEEGSITAGERTQYSWLQGRYPLTARGDKFLVMRRSPAGPNRLTQQVRGLQPGRLYSLKAITSDYQDLLNEVSRKDTNAVRFTLEGVELLNGPKQSFQFTFPNCYAHHLGKFDAKHIYWMNYHWQVFRAQGETATLTIADWPTDAEPGGPVGQETMVNFVELQPYLE